ncbi:MAG: hypothetical protein OEW75_10280 [Cyclobacteriaceae bacterium]|nr:hypothetical protein [Cyclobacteriaceae bacterium]
MKQLLKISGGVLFGLFPAIAMGHDGHGLVDNGVTHYVTSPEHFVWGVVAFSLITFILLKKAFNKG